MQKPNTITQKAQGNMLKNERHKYILHNLQMYNKVLSSDLSDQLKVSEDTVRRDLKELSDKGRLIKVHGGALSKSYHLYTYQENNIYAHDKKIKIARKAAKLLKNGQTIIMSGGTTNLELARILPPDLKATIFTYSLPIALQLTEHPSIEVIFIGGKLLKNSQVTIGMDVIKTLSEIRADLCILGTTSIDEKAGITEIDWEVTKVKQAMIEASGQVISLIISEKLGTRQRFTVCDLKSIHTLITDLDPKKKPLSPYNDTKLNIL